MKQTDIKEKMNTVEKDPVKRSGETHSGTPNAVDPNEERTTGHKSGYGGEGGAPRTSTDKREKPPAR